MEKRTLLALGLILLVLYLSNKFIYKPVIPPEAPPGETVQETGTSDTLPEAPATPAYVEPESTSIMSRSVEPETAEPEITKSETTIVKTDRYTLYFSSRGGILVGATLRDYEYFPDGSRVRLIPDGHSDFLGLALSSKKDTLDLMQRTFVADKERLELNEARPEGKLTLTSAIGTADTVRIEYTFENDSFLIEALLELPELNRQGEGWKVHYRLGPAFRPTEKDSVKNDFPSFGAAYMVGDKVTDRKMSKFKDGEMEFVKGPLPWVCMVNKYFLVGLIGRSNQFEGFVMQGDKEKKQFTVKPVMALEPGDRDVTYEIYIGPQDYRQLERVGLGFEKMVEYGWWIIKPFTKLILVVMLWMHRFITNYGIVIIVFSVFTKLLFYPLTKKSLQASKDMQLLQPHIKELREKYKDDPKKLQEETMRLYKERKVNPLGGCLPLIVQMPVLWALFYVFQRTIEFRGEAFALWIQDLSAPDSPPVLPIVMGLSMYLQQKMTPSTDPRMAPMQFIMPVVLTVVFINFPAGLVLYWTVNNIMSILQQYHMKRNDTQVTRGGGEKARGNRKSAGPKGNN